VEFVRAMKQLAAFALAAILTAGCAAESDESVSSNEAASKAEAGHYPIILAHGFFGFEKFAGLDFIDYFYKVKAHLAERGENVYTPAVDPFNSTEYRGRQLLAHVERILRETGAKKVDIIGHSQGGIDARWVAHERPDLVASVVTFASPHQGTEFADVVLGVVKTPVVGKVVDEFVRFIGRPLWDELGHETSLVSSVRQLSTDGMREFNAKYPDAPGVKYWSIAGRTALSLGGDACDAPAAPAFIKQWEKERDTTEPLFKPVELLLGGLDRTPNDGLMLVESARRGNFLGCVPADHLDQIGHLMGDKPGWFNSFNHLTFYAELVAWLRAQGL
jgi:triacylglycerol lipase